MPKLKSVAIVASLAVVGIAGCAELVARKEGFGAPLLYRAASSGYEIAPNQHVERLGKVMHINALGTRGGPITPFPTSDIWRVMVLGDSVANGGSQIDDAQTFPAIASRHLERNGCHNEILNASAGGWSLFDEIAWIHNHGMYGARTLVWTINSLDLDQQPSTAGLLDHNPSFPSHRPAMALSEIVFRYALPRMGLGASAADSGSVMDQQFAKGEFASVGQLVAATKREMDRYGVQLIVLFHDTLTPLSANRSIARAQFFEQLSADGIPLLKTGLAQRSDARIFYMDTIHPNVAGDAEIGSKLADSLQTQCPLLSIYGRHIL
jgi:hypothetical protein